MANATGEALPIEMLAQPGFWKAFKVKKRRLLAPLKRTKPQDGRYDNFKRLLRERIHKIVPVLVS